MSWDGQSIESGDQQQQVDHYDETGGYDDNYVTYIAPPPGHELDEAGRLLKPATELINWNDYPEDLDLFLSKWQHPRLSSENDWRWSTRYVWPDVNGIVQLKRLDLYETDTPNSQQATTDMAESRRIRATGVWYAVRSIFFLDRQATTTTELLIESTGPPRRHRVSALLHIAIKIHRFRNA